MQRLAAQLNLSETAFLVACEGEYGLRWFTPVAEVDLCGHATLASAHWLWDSGRLGRSDEARFHTKSGLLRATLGDDDMIWLDFPAEPATESVDRDRVALVAEALGFSDSETIEVAANRLDLIVGLGTEAAVRSAAPNFSRLAEVEARGVMITAQAQQAASEGIDFVSRYFAPRFGIDEDPVTGSAHCCLAPWWAAVLGRTRLTGYQASSRGGRVEVEIVDDRVRLGGHARTVWVGDLRP